MAEQLRMCRMCAYLEDVDKHPTNPDLDRIYCSKSKEAFERRQKPWHCYFSPIVDKRGIADEDVRR